MTETPLDNRARERIAETSPSILEAAAQLEAVLEAAPVLDTWCARVAAALDDCRQAVLYHLETLEGDAAGDGGMKADLAREEPRLLSRLEQLDHEFHHLLPELDDAGAASVPLRRTVVQPLARLVSDLRQAADQELDIVYESLRPIGEGD